MSLSGQILKSLFPISAETFEKMAGERYGFQEDMAQTWLGFKPVAETLVAGFHAVLDDSRLKVLVPRLNSFPSELRGIAYEGAGMGLTVLDALFPWKKRLQAFLIGPGARYIGLVYIGAGLVLPRMPKKPEHFIKQLDPVLGWLVLDGYGFYEGFFSSKRYVEEKAIPTHLSPYARRVFDHGLGRSLWFSTGANADRIFEAIDAFPSNRRADLWSGIGLACAYAAGVVDRAAIEKLQMLAGPYLSQLGVGSAIASRFRLQSGHAASHTELACHVLWGCSSDMVAHITDLAMQELPLYGEEPAYEIWRKRIEERFITHTQKMQRQKETIQ